MGSLTSLSGPSVYLDANIFIYAVEGFPGSRTKLGSLFARLDRGDLLGVTSELTLAEVLVKPLRDGNAAVCDVYRRMIQTSPALRSPGGSRHAHRSGTPPRGFHPETA